MQIDLFAQPITLTYQGKDTFATSFGGFVSLILVVIFILMGVSQYLSLVNSMKSHSYHQSHNDLNDEIGLFNLSNSANFSIGIQIYNKESGEILKEGVPSTIGEFSVSALRSETINSVSNSTHRQTSSSLAIPLKFGKCENNLIPFSQIQGSD